MENIEITVKENTVEIVKTMPVLFKHTLSELIEQRDNILRVVDEFTAQRMKEVDELNTIIEEAKNKGAVEETKAV